MGDVHGGDVERTLQAGDLGAHLHAQLGVEVGERLVHQERLRLTHDGAAHRDTLALATGEATGLAIEVVRELEDARRFVDALVDLLLGHLLQLQCERDVVAHAEVRVQRVRLEDHGDVAILRIEVVDQAAADVHVAAGDGLESGDHAQRGGLAATGWTDQDEELAVVHLQRQIAHGVKAVVVHLLDMLQCDVPHAVPLLCAVRFGEILAIRLFLA